jgi:hypothetical protein
LKRRPKGKKRIIVYNTSFGIGSMKRHIEFEYLELITSYVEKVVAENISGS